MHPSVYPPGGRERSTAARLATSGETFELAKLSTPSAQAVVQRRMSFGTDCSPKPDESKPAAKRFGSRLISGTSGAREATGLVPQADPDLGRSRCRKRKGSADLDK